MSHEQIIENISTIRQDIAAMNESLKSAHKRIDKIDALTAQIHQLATSVNTLAYEVKTRNEQSEKIEVRIGELEAKSGKRWDAVAEKILMCGVAAVIAFLAANLGL